MADNRFSVGKRLRQWSAALVAMALIATGLSVLTPAAPASAANGADFNAGNIVSDGVFYDPNAMSQAQIQGFLDSKVSSCAAGYTCLENYRQTTTSRPADAMCSAYSGVANQRASEIIFAVAQACGINPQVLVVLLEKEQGLVSSTAPSETRYRIATGYACPDTAPCDAQFFGFYNQVYKAAWQYERYRLYPGSYSYRAGRVNTIQWHPNAACGSSQVYIENQATAGLYIYTPYRPNAAALGNMYGTGDGCSSYGNRNFFRIFTDWFGSTQGGGSFAKTADSGTIYLIAGAYKYEVPSMDVLDAYWALGPYRTVSADYLAQFTTGIKLGQVVRDPTTGEIFYTDAGLKHHVTSCEQLVHYGSSCSLYIDITPTQIRTLATGVELTQFARSQQTGAVYYVVNGEKRWLRTMDEVLRLNGGTMPNFISLGVTALATLRTGPDYVGPGNLIRQAGSTTSHLVDSDRRLRTLAPSTLAGEYTAAAFEVSAATFSSFSAAGNLALTVTCGANSYIAGAGQLWNLSSRSTFGLPNSALDASTCAAMPKGQTVGQPLFLRSPSTGSIYYVAAGKKSYLSSMSAVLGLNGGTVPPFVPISDGTLATIANGPELLGPAQLVKTAGNPTVYLVDGLTKKVPIDSFEAAADLGVTGYSVVADSVLGTYTAAGTLSSVLACGSETWIGGSGQLWRIASNSSSGLPVTALDAMTCAAMPKSTQTVAGPLFLRSPATGAVYSVAAGKKKQAATMDEVYALNGGTAPVLVPMSATALAKIPS